MKTIITPLKRWHYIQCKHQCSWTNCGGYHLILQLPTGDWHDTGSRSKNCRKPLDTEHRCWNVWGELPFITMNCDGNSCHVGGAGSVLTRDWHGVLTRGEWHADDWRPWK